MFGNTEKCAKLCKFMHIHRNTWGKELVKLMSFAKTVKAKNLPPKTNRSTYV